jgi:hypothetical protein
VGIAIAALALVLGVAACGEKTVDPDAAATTIADFVERETGFSADDVECPDDVKAEVGETFECTFTGPEGPYVASVEITEVEDDDARFRIDTRRAG